MNETLPKLRPYQREDIDYLKRFKTSGCFNEQRTGKTPTSLSVFNELRKQRIVIICPASAIYPWGDEFERWLLRPCMVIDGPPQRRMRQIENWTDGLVISYDTLKETTRTKGMVTEILIRHPDAIILDEAHRIKNPKSAAARAAIAFRHIEYRMALTGTPAPNKPHEIYQILNWLYPERFTSYWKFIDEFFTKTVQSARGHQYIEIGTFKSDIKRLELQQYLHLHCTQRKRRDVMPWLPEKDYQQVRLPATPDQEKYLKELEQYFETEHIITQGILDRLVRYRQICLHPGLLNLKGHSPKLNYIKQYIADYPDTPTIVFSKFTSFIKILQAEIKEKIGVIIGETPKKDRDELVKAFQKGKINLLIINIDAGKEALTLDRAEAIIFTDKYPPAGDIQQAEDRFIATTEAGKDKPHKIIELMIKGTYDEHLYELLEKRFSETDIINDYKKYLQERRS